MDLRKLNPVKDLKMAMALNVKKLTGNFFVLAALGMICLVYYTFVIKLYLPMGLESITVRVILGCFHITFPMLVWSFFQTMVTDPGKVPPYWGFYINDSEQKRKRYCLMCHVFKPERCHHCSTCNRCVLNMDHHCPWINNCVGFNNRKLFILLLFYLILNVYFLLAAMALPVYDIVVYLLTESVDLQFYPQLLIVAVFLFLSIFSIVLTMFVNFHIQLILKNSTTIENMDKKLKSTFPYNNGVEINLLQVFGKNKWLWLLPMYGQSGKPIGGGVNWNKSLRPSASDNIDEEVPGDSEQRRVPISNQNIVVDTPKEQIQPVSPPKTQQAQKLDDSAVQADSHRQLQPQGTDTNPARFRGTPDK